MSKRRDTLVPEYKKFDGQLYKYLESWFARKASFKRTRALRRAGYKVRLFKAALYRGDPNPEYRIYRIVVSI